MKDDFSSTLYKVTGSASHLQLRHRGERTVALRVFLLLPQSQVIGSIL